VNAGPSPLKTIATLAALTLLVPLSLAIVVSSVIVGAVRRMFDPPPSRSIPSPAKNVLISGGKMTKALQLARSFHAAGHRVVLTESHKYWLTGHRFSRAVDRFHTLPAPGSADYVDALASVIERENIDVYVPVCSPAASIWDSKAMPQISRHCEVVHVRPETIDTLDNKYAFARTAQSLGLRAPKSFLVTSHADVLTFDFRSEARPYILKSIAYDSIRRLDLTQLPRATVEETEAFVRSLPIAPDRPWVMQEFIAGTEYCTHGTLRAGELRIHCCCRSSPFQINYRHEERPDIERWVRRFGEALDLTGQVSMDFIQADDDGEIYAIECNPRTHSAITMFYDHPDVASAYLGGPLRELPIGPLPSSRPTYWLYHELWRLFTSLGSPRRMLERLLVLARGKDAVLAWRDPLPFIMLHHWHIPLLLLNDLRERRGWLRIDFNIGKLVQPGGD
jgi:predicted ATP-grasp superfamily ATP-dependent carboligase